MRIARRLVAAGVLVLGLAGTWAGGAEASGWAREPRREAAGPEAKAARRRWAATKMDEMANEARRCRQRFQKQREIETCEAEFTRKFRQYNEVYLEASRGE